MSKEFIYAILKTTILFSISTLICAISYIMYGSLNNAPAMYKYGVILFAVLSFIYILIKKIKIINNGEDVKGLKALSKNKAFSHLYLNISSILFVAFALFLILLQRFDAPWLLLPILVIAYGACVIISAHSLGIKELSISGYLIILMGLITAYFLKSSVLLWTMSEITIILFLLFFAILVSHRESK
jgi:hypothetical protein